MSVPIPFIEHSLTEHSLSVALKESILRDINRLKSVDSFKSLEADMLLERPSLDGHTRYYVPPALDAIEIGRLKFYSPAKQFGFFIVPNGELFFHLKGFRQVVRTQDQIDFAVPDEQDEQLIHNELVHYMQKPKNVDAADDQLFKVAFISGPAKKGKMAVAWTRLPLWRQAESEVSGMLYHGIAIFKKKAIPRTVYVNTVNGTQSEIKTEESVIELIWKGRNQETLQRLFAKAVKDHQEHWSENHKPIIVKLIATNPGDTSTDRLQWVDLQTGEPVAMAC